MDLQLTGKRALVLASSRGLGRAIAEQLASEGAKVIIVGRNAVHLQETKQALDKVGGGQVFAFSADVSNKTDLEKLADYAKDTFGVLDILVNNSGGPPAGTFLSFSDDDWQKAFEGTLLSYIRMIRATLPLLEKAGGGHIINIASSSIRKPIDNLILSNTFRPGIVGLTKTLAGELADRNILINTLAPGKIATDRVVALDRKKSEQLGVPVSELQSRSEAEIPLGRYGTPEEFARVAVFLASDACSYLTGTSLLVDGGLVRSI